MYWRQERIEVKRDELYQEVWATPMAKLASKYNVSDVALAKVCKKLNIPVPQRGYWAKLQHGKSPRRSAHPS